jgi:hypothetical protein
MKKRGLILMAVMMAVLPVLSAYAGSAGGTGGQASVELRFAVRVPERISMKAQEDNGQVNVRVAALTGPGAVVDVSGGASNDGSPMRRGAGDSVLNTVVENDAKSSFYTVASP